MRELFVIVALLVSHSAHPIDLGVRGYTFAIAEESIIVVIERKLKALAANGELDKHNQQLAAKMQESAKRPRPVANITRARQLRTWTFDPTTSFNSDIFDHKGQVIVRAGTKVNPLDYVTWGQPLILIDGDDELQVSWALKQQGKIVLVRGEPLTLEKKFRRFVFFDQGGRLSNKFKIAAVPALISQEGKCLKIQEVPLKQSDLGGRRQKINTTIKLQHRGES